MDCDLGSVSKNTLVQNQNIDNKEGELKSCSTKKRLNTANNKTSESEDFYSTMKNFNEGIISFLGIQLFSSCSLIIILNKEGISNWDISNADDTIENSDLENFSETVSESTKTKKVKQDDQLNEKKASKLTNKVQVPSIAESTRKTKN